MTSSPAELRRRAAWDAAVFRVWRWRRLVGWSAWQQLCQRGWSVRRRGSSPCPRLGRGLQTVRQVTACWVAAGDAACHLRPMMMLTMMILMCFWRHRWSAHLTTCCHLVSTTCSNLLQLQSSTGKLQSHTTAMHCCCSLVFNSTQHSTEERSSRSLYKSPIFEKTVNSILK